MKKRIVEMLSIAVLAMSLVGCAQNEVVAPTENEVTTTPVVEVTVTPVPVITEEPEVIVTVTPTATVTPSPVVEEEAVEEVIEVTVTPVPTEALEEVEEIEVAPTETPEVEEVVEITALPTPTEVPQPTATPSPVPTKAPTATPVPTKKPEPTKVPTKAPTATPTPTKAPVKKSDITFELTGELILNEENDGYYADIFPGRSIVDILYPSYYDFTPSIKKNKDGSWTLDVHEGMLYNIGIKVEGKTERGNKPDVHYEEFVSGAPFYFDTVYDCEEGYMYMGVESRANKELAETGFQLEDDIRVDSYTVEVPLCDYVLYEEHMYDRDHKTGQLVYGSAPECGASVTLHINVTRGFRTKEMIDDANILKEIIAANYKTDLERVLHLWKWFDNYTVYANTYAQRVKLCQKYDIYPWQCLDCESRTGMMCKYLKYLGVKCRNDAGVNHAYVVVTVEDGDYIIETTASGLDMVLMGIESCRGDSAYSTGSFKTMEEEDHPFHKARLSDHCIYGDTPIEGFPDEFEVIDYNYEWFADFMMERYGVKTTLNMEMAEGDEDHSFKEYYVNPVAALK